MVEETIIDQIDKKLSRGTINNIGSRHGECTPFVIQPSSCFICNSILWGLLIHISIKSSSLNHKVGYDSVENQIVVETIINV